MFTIKFLFPVLIPFHRQNKKHQTQKKKKKDHKYESTSSKCPCLMHIKCQWLFSKGQQKSVQRTTTLKPSKLFSDVVVFFFSFGLNDIFLKLVRLFPFLPSLYLFLFDPFDPWNCLQWKCENNEFPISWISRVFSFSLSLFLSSFPLFLWISFIFLHNFYQLRKLHNNKKNAYPFDPFARPFPTNECIFSDFYEQSLRKDYLKITLLQLIFRWLFC